ncbi:ArnT family glycosyltransferase [Patescibacteria group bacterium]
MVRAKMAKAVKNTKLILLVILFIASFLRLWKISVNPPSLFGDELDVGYQAYSILKTGRDYYGNFMPIHFHSLAEWRTPLYLYSTVPTVAVFGISPLGVRLPAAIFGIMGVLAIYLLISNVAKDKQLGLVASLVMAVNPWHIQYSRAGFEVTQLIFFLLLGLWLFFKSFKNGKYLWVSMLSFALTPWTYSTAKLFTPVLLLFLFFVWRKEIFKLSRKYLVYAAIALFVIGAPIAYSTLFGGGTQRFDYISIFSDPTTETEVGSARLNDARARGELGEGLNPTLLDRVIHNKYTFWGTGIAKNYLDAFSTQFLFIKGDLNLRHSIGMGEFYKVEIVALILGIILFFTSKFPDSRIKVLIAFWILLGVVPAAITRDGGNHATRLIITLPPLIFLISYGVFRLKKFLLFVYAIGWMVCIGIYLHNYYVHYPRVSERWWHWGFGPGISQVKSIDKDYDKVVISTFGEPPWIFFAGWYEYPPDIWQKNFPIGNDVELTGFGKVSHIDKFYFAHPQDGIYGMGRSIDDKTLYLANAKEIGANLIIEPDRTPPDLKLLKTFAYPSGEPAFYLFSGR